jgi:hypothetical protein
MSRNEHDFVYGGLNAISFVIPALVLANLEPAQTTLSAIAWGVFGWRFYRFCQYADILWVLRTAGNTLSAIVKLMFRCYDT